MILIECRQGSLEWLQARCGVITASMFGEATKRLKSGSNKGDYTEAAKNYAFRLAIERISGELMDEGFETWQMRRGHELEEACRIRHEADIKQIVDLAGFAVTEDYKFGCSLDAQIGDDGCGEYKCFLAPDKLRSILVEDDWDDITPQVQGCLWVTGRKWMDMCLYCPALVSVGRDFTRRRVNRDDDYIERMEQDLLAFDALVCKWESILRNEQQQMRAA